MIYGFGVLGDSRRLGAPRHRVWIQAARLRIVWTSTVQCPEHGYWQLNRTSLGERDEHPGCLGVLMVWRVMGRSDLILSSVSVPFVTLPLRLAAAAAATAATTTTTKPSTTTTTTTATTNYHYHHHYYYHSTDDAFGN